MALYAIGDLHLSEGCDKPMDVFGGRWLSYTDKIKSGFSELGGDDLCVICGDISWGMKLEEAGEDFKFIAELPGKKIILKGNHDYWWSTQSKIKQYLSGIGISGIEFLHNNCHFFGEIAICGTRGWFYEEERGGGHDKKIMLREIRRLETSLKAAGAREKYVFLHYPPIYGRYRCQEILSLFNEYDVKMCCYGHIHGPALNQAFEGRYDGVAYRIVSADHLGFTPLKIAE